MQTLVQAKNVENVDMQELQERQECLRNIVTRGIKEVNKETPQTLAIAIEKFFDTSFGMSKIMVYGAHRVGKQEAS